jgi:hypothetical protein
MYRIVCDRNKIMGVSKCGTGRREFYANSIKNRKELVSNEKENMEQIVEEVQECGGKIDGTEREERRGEERRGE